AWWKNIPTSPPDRAIFIRAGKWSTRRNGCRTTTPACAWTRAAPAARPVSSITSRRARRKTFTIASNGRGCSLGRTARSGSTASHITASTSGTLHRCSRVTSDLVCGPETLSEEELARNRTDFGAQIVSHPMDDDYHKARSPRWDKVTTPLFSAANWGGQGLHPRGNFEGFVRAAAKHKWLEAH